ncbi:MAG TPA: hypothetical protein VND93_14125, partial [Myxococcales bacterium]|nr:hypothetical protein [Myxococcales bacterium]
MLDREKAVVVLAALAVAVAGCPAPPPEPECGDLRSFDLAGCDQFSLGLLYSGGIFNANLHWSNGKSTPAAIYAVVGGGEKINGHTVTSRLLNRANFYLASRYTENGNDQRLAFAGCQAESTVHLTGQVQLCANGVKADEGTFEAQYLDWGVGESESSPNVKLVSETKVAQG